MDFLTEKQKQFMLFQQWIAQHPEHMATICLRLIKGTTFLGLGIPTYTVISEDEVEQNRVLSIRWSSDTSSVQRWVTIVVTWSNVRVIKDDGDGELYTHEQLENVPLANLIHAHITKSKKIVCKKQNLIEYR